MRNFSLIFGLPTYSSNFSNYEKPVSSSLDADCFYLVNDRVTQMYQHQFTNNEIYNDRGIFMKKTMKEKYSTVGRVISNNQYRKEGNVSCDRNNMRACQAYLNFGFFSGSKTVRVTRAYKSLTMMMSEIGGIHNVIFLIFASINSVYIFYKRNTILAENVFSISTLSKIIPKKIRREDERFRKVSVIDGKTREGSRGGMGKAEVDCLEEKSMALVGDCLDVSILMREVSAMKVISHLFFKSYHLKLIPLIAMNLETDNEQNRRSLSKEDGKMNRVNEAITMQNAIDQLRHNAFKVKRMPVQNINLEEKIDLVLWDVLNRKHMRSEGVQDGDRTDRVSNEEGIDACLMTSKRESHEQPESKDHPLPLSSEPYAKIHQLNIRKRSYYKKYSSRIKEVESKSDLKLEDVHENKKGARKIQRSSGLIEV